MSFFSITCWVTGAFGLLFAVIVMRQGRKAHILWALTCLSISTWIFGLGSIVSAPNREVAMVWLLRVHYPGALMIAPLFFHFVTVVFQRKLRAAVITSYALAVVCQILSITGNMVTVTARERFFAFYPEPLPLYVIFVVYFLVFSFYAHWILWDAMKSFDLRLRNQARWIMAGTAIGFLGGSTTFLFLYHLPVYPFGTYAVIIYIPTVTYAIVRYQLMEIQVVIKRTVVYSTLSAILIAVYVATLTIVTKVTERFIPSPSVWSSAFAAAVIAILFEPLRRRLQSAVDRRFFRKQAPRVVREVSEGYAHEIKTPLANIVLPAELAHRDLREALERGDTIEPILPKLLARLQYIIDQAMVASRRVEAVQQVLEADREGFGAVNVKGLLDQSLEGLKGLIDDVHARVAVRCDEKVAVEGNPKQLEVVFINLFKNALEAMSRSVAPDKRELFVNVARLNREVRIEIADSGPGLAGLSGAERVRPRPSTKGAEGTGIGLSLVYRMIEGHGGRITVQNRDTGGAMFSIVLPTSGSLE